MTDEKDLKQQLYEIENAIVMIDQKIENHIDNSGRSHEIMRSDIGALDRRQERLEAKMDSFFESIASFRDELSKMNINMVTYNSQLAEHMRRTALNEDRLNKMEEIISALAQRDTKHEADLTKFKIVSATIAKVFVGIAGAIGLIWTMIQIVNSVHN